MNNHERELAKAQIMNAPKRVTYVCALANLLGLIVALRILLLGSMPLKKSVLFAALMFFNFFLSGMSVVAKRSRMSYVLLVMSATRCAVLIQPSAALDANNRRMAIRLAQVWHGYSGPGSIHPHRLLLSKPLLERSDFLRLETNPANRTSLVRSTN